MDYQIKYQAETIIFPIAQKKDDKSKQLVLDTHCELIHRIGKN